jgi:transposase
VATRHTAAGRSAATCIGRGIRTTILCKKNEHRGGTFDREIYRSRNRIERLINRLKQYRRVATRYEKRAENYQAMLTIAAIMLWL